MQERIIIGRYIDTKSWIHQLDPRSKIVTMILFICIIFMIDTFMKVIIVSSFATAIILCTKIPLSIYLKMIKPLLFIILFIAIFHIIFDASGSRLIELGPLNIYAGGLEKGILAALRMLTFIAFTAILTLTTPPAKLNQGLEDVFLPLKWMKLSPQKITLMTSIALRFIPSIFEEAEKILKAQSSRGFELSERSFREKARIIISLLVPVTIGAFRRALDVVDSMEARGYRLGMKRSKYQELVWKRNDSLFVATTLGVLFLFIIIDLL